MRKANTKGFPLHLGLWGGGLCLLLAGISAQGCSDESNGATGTSSTSSSSTSTSTSSSSSSSTSSGSAAPTIEPACNGDSFNTPLDATPDPDGKNVYFIAFTPLGETAIFSGLTDGSAVCNALHTGAPLVAPLNIAISTDGNTLFIADTGGDDADDATSTDAGQILSMPASGGVPVPIAGTQGLRPRGIEVLKGANGDMIYFAGTDPMTREGALYRIDSAGGAANVVAKGSPMVDPSGLAIASDGTAYLCDTINSEFGTSTLIAVQNGTAKVIANDIRGGYPCGVSITADEQTVLVSGYNAQTETDAVVVVDVATSQVSLLSNGIDQFTESAGLHRAKNLNRFAWADSKANKSGTVFTVELKP